MRDALHYWASTIWHAALNAYEHDGIGERDDGAAIAEIEEGLRQLVDDVRNGSFPSPAPQSGKDDG